MTDSRSIFILSVQATQVASRGHFRIGISEIARQCGESPTWCRLYEGTEARLWRDAFTAVLREYEFSDEENADHAVLMFYDVYRHVDRELETRRWHFLDNTFTPQVHTPDEYDMADYLLGAATQ